MSSRYSWGADEHLVVQITEDMSLESNFKAMAMASDLEAQQVNGLVDICPANASLLVRFDPDQIAPDEVERIVRAAEDRLEGGGPQVLETRIFELPVWYNDPFTNETGARFRSHHQTPDKTDLEFAAEENNLPNVEAFIEAHSGSPWITSMVGFVAGLPF
ncbi:MAG: carboxyltransferase domain-containing protein, partial [Actinomycetota bacterium]|nr:carboxyltransferase domain-containing protein [Actinomycetota bacterium]